MAIKPKALSKDVGIVVYGRSEAEAAKLYSDVALGNGVACLASQSNSGQVQHYLTHVSLSNLSNPDTGRLDDLEELESDGFAVQASDQDQQVDVFYSVCSDGCGAHIISDHDHKFCPSCSSELPEDEDEMSDDEEEMDDADFEIEEDDSGDDEFESESSDVDPVLVVTASTFDEAVALYRGAKSGELLSVVSGAGRQMFVTHASAAEDFNYDPLLGGETEISDESVALSSESGDEDEMEAHHYVCSDDNCGQHTISESSDALLCARCGSGLIDPADLDEDFDSESSDEDEDFDAELESLNSEISELDALIAESSDEEDEEEIELEDVDYSDIDSDVDDDEDEEEEDYSPDLENMEMESESSDDDLDEDLDPDAEEDLDAEDILESESYEDFNEDEFESESADDELDLDAIESELNELDSDDDMESESSGDEIYVDDLDDILSESSGEEEDEEMEESDDEFEDADEEDEEEMEESDDDEISGLDLESESSHVEELDVDLLQALSSTEDLDVSKFHVAHCGSVCGESMWTAFYGKLPVATASEQYVRENKQALATIFDDSKYGEAVRAHANAEGIDSALEEFGFERINPEFNVNAVVEHTLMERAEARVNEIQAQANEHAQQIEANRQADLEHNLERMGQAIATAALGINRGVFSGISNPVASKLIASLSAAGLKNADTLVLSAFADQGDAYSKILVGQAQELLSHDEATQNALSELVVNASANGGSVANTNIEDRLSSFEPVTTKVMQSESSEIQNTSNRFRAILNK